jgi:hypothetical protein
MSYVPHWTNNDQSDSKRTRTLLACRIAGYSVLTMPPTDPPPSAAGRALLGPPPPAETLGADVIAFEQTIAAPWPTGVLIAIGKVAHTQLDRINPQPLGCFIHCGLKTERARRTLGNREEVLALRSYTRSKQLYASSTI